MTDPIQRGADAIYTTYGQRNLGRSERIVRAVIDAVSTEIDCPRRDISVLVRRDDDLYQEATLTQVHVDGCDLCGGSGKVRIVRGD